MDNLNTSLLRSKISGPSD